MSVRVEFSLGNQSINQNGWFMGVLTVTVHERDIRPITLMYFLDTIDLRQPHLFSGQRNMYK